MPPRRKRILTVKGWPNPKKGKLYKGLVKSADTKTMNLHIKIENLDPTQLGRIHEMDLPLPVRPSIYHKTCAFVIACGINADIDGAEISLDDVEGTTIGMRFSKAAADGSQQIEFEKIEDSTTPNPPKRESVDLTNQQQLDPNEVVIDADKFGSGN